MRLTLQKLTILFTLTFCITLVAQAQSLPEEGSLGIRANINGQSTIELPYMMNANLSIAPYLGFSTTENTSTTFMVGVRPRYYMGVTSSVATYFTGMLGFSNTSIDGTSSS
ncbi:MAG: hypothetical protein WD597_01860, partial [Balneolaceae bacterium]